MIKFNGIDLQDIAPVKIEDIDVSPIALSPVTRPRPIQYGSEFVRMSGGTRKVTITFALLEMNRDERENAAQAIREWASTDVESVLELPHFATRHLECICTMLPDFSYRKWWENKLRIEFTCFNNVYWTSNDVIEVPCGVAFSIGGSAQPLMTIERNGVTKLTDQVYTNGVEAMTFSQIPAGNMVIDLNRQTAQIGQTSIMQYYDPTSTWMIPKVGAYQVIYGTGTIKYRERWV